LKLLNTIKQTRLSRAFLEFTKNQRSLGLLLILCTILSLSLSNSAWSDKYLAFWHHYLSFGFSDFTLEMSIGHFINDALMAVFFLLVGLEIKRELYAGELSSFVKASLPIAAALGGMVVPILIYLSVNAGSDTVHGWGVPMATDIAFAIGILSLAGNRVPVSLKVLLTALAVVDDLGAVIVIALFYTSSIAVNYLLLSLACLVLLFVLNKFQVRNLYYYLIPGIFLWYFVFLSGVHATVAGVLLAFMIPLKAGEKNNPLLKLEHSLQVPVNFFIMPLFALANTAIVLNSGLLESISSLESVGIALGLLIGKPIGIVSFIYLSVRAGISKLPEGTGFRQLLGLGFLGGIGFTMSIFIALLSFDSESHIFNSKIAILCSSLLAGLIGYLLIKSTLNEKQ
jgi:NhaA family Na+:H+ antiporter